MSTRVVQKLHHRVAVAAVVDAYSELTRLVTSLDEADFLRATHCSGWAVCNVVFHVLLDAQRALVAFGTPSSKPPSTDHVAYWRDWATHRDDDAAAAHARFVRVGAAAYSDPASLVGHWQATAQAVVHTVGQVPGSDLLTTQGHSFTATDLLGTLAVEATIHHLDLLRELPGKPEPRPGAVQLSVDVLDALLGESVERPAWDDLTWLLKGSGRIPLTPTERKALGPTSARFPLLG